MPILRPVLRASLAAVPLLLVTGLLPATPASAAPVDEPAAAVAAGTITGTLTVEGTGEPLEAAEVALWRNESGDETPDFAVFETFSADPQGRYEITAEPGRYRLQFIDTTGQNTTEFHRDAATVEQGRDVVLRDGESTTIDAALAEKGSVVGRITGEQDEPLPDVEVRLWEDRGLLGFPEWEQAVDTVVTDADGRYRVYAEPGPYRVQFVDPMTNPEPRHATEWFRNAPDLEGADDVLLGTGALTADARLTTRGTVAGTVTGADGPVLPGLDVTLYETTDRGASWTPTLTTTTDASGSYEFLTAPDTYRLGFADPDDEYYPEFHDDAETVGTGDDIEVGLAIADVDAVLARQPDPLTNLTPPSVDGTPIVGETLGARSGTWDPQPEDTRYQWYADGTKIPGATGALFQPGPEHRGDDVLVEVTVGATDFLDTTLRSEAVGPVRQRYEATTAPSVVGTPEVGETLTGLTGTWSPTPVGFTYRWLADGETIPGAVGSSIALAEAHRGARISLEVTAPDDGDFVETSVRSVEVGPVTQAIRNTVAPTVGGDAVVGSTVTAQHGSWSPEPASYAYQWYADEVAITGATNRTLAVRAAQRGTELTVAVTARRDGYVATTTRSAPSERVTEPHRATAAPALTGTARVGQTLSASTGTWTGTPAGFAYQWYADEVAITGATTSAFTVTAQERGKALRVEVTALGTHPWTDGTARSTATGAATETLTETTRPTITGTPVVGQSLSVSDGAWSGPVASYRFQWYAGQTAIDGATERTFTPTSAQRAAALTVRVTAVGSGPWLDGRATSPATATVAEVIVNRQRPTVTGSFRVGQTLSADPGTWSGGPGTYDYQWYADDTPLDGATGRTLALTSAQRGIRMSVRVTARGDGDWLASAPVYSVRTSTVLQPRTVSSRPTLTGDLRVGEVLTAEPGVFVPAATDLRYAWFADDEPIPGATGSTYELTTDERGARVSVDVVASATDDGWAETPSTSDERGPVTQPLAATTAPTVAGVPAVGSRLTARPGTWSGTTSRYDYQWYADGVPLDGETDQTLDLTGAVRGADVLVEVTARGTGGWTDASARSAAVGPVEEPLVSTAAPTVTGTPRVGSVLTATDGEWAPAPTDVRHQWFADGEAIDGATGTTYTPTAAERGASVLVEVTASAAGSADTTVRSAAVGPVTQAVVSTARPTVTGSPRLGRTLTARSGTWSPAPAGYRYQWYADGVRIAGATRTTFTPTAAQLGDPLTVRVTATGPDLVGKAASSKPTAAVTAVPTVRLTGAVKGAKLTLSVTVTVPGLAAVPGRVALTTGRKKLGTVTLKKGRGTLTVGRPRKPTAYTATYLGSGSLLTATGSVRTR